MTFVSKPRMAPRVPPGSIQLLLACALGTICLSLFAANPSTGEDSALAVDALRCELAVDPLGVDVSRPRLSWNIASGERGQKQSAYQIVVSSDAEAVADGRADLWDSGKVASGDTLHIPYGGEELQSSQQVFWRVRVWDQDGKPAAWSAPASWTMGMVTPADWRARWIKAPSKTDSLRLRREFTVRPGLKRAIAHVSGLGHFELSINGEKVGPNLLSPGWTKYNKTSLYETHDVSAALVEGANAVGIALGSGMYHVEKGERYAKFLGSFGPLCAIAQIDLEYADGTKEHVITDKTWRVNRGSITYSSVFGGEDFDARLDEPGWNSAGFGAKGWDAAVEFEPTGVLRGLSASAPPLREIEVLRPVAVKQLSKTQDVVDLGQNASLMPRIRVMGPAGSTIRLTHAEVTHPDGSINRASSGNAPAWWQYTKRSDEEESWFPQFFYAGCRYLQVDKIPAQPGEPLPWLADIEGVVVHSVAEPVGDFSCSNELLNRIRRLVRWAQRSNMVSVLTDCPHREKLGWVEQFHLNGPAIRYEFDVTRILTKGVCDMRDSQTESGLVPNIAPELTEFGGAFRAATEWGAAFIIVPWQHYQFTGDLSVCRENYPAMRRYMEYLSSHAKNHIIDEGLGDWYDLGPVRPPGFAQLTFPPVTATAFYYQDAAYMAQIAALLGETADAETYAKLATDIRAAWLREFRDPQTGRYATNSQCANALALVMGLAEPEDRSAALAALIEDIRTQGNAVTTGDVGFRYLLVALAQAGRSDVIQDILLQDGQPGYAFQLNSGATSLTEAWDANHQASQNHFMLGQVNEWFYQDLVGISSDPQGPGFKQIIIKPTPVRDVTWARAKYRSVRGPIECHWSIAGPKFELEVTIPANTTATVLVPSQSADEVTESGRPASQAPGVKFLRQDGTRSVYAIESGTYKFSSVP